MEKKEKIIIIGAGGHGREVADFIIRGVTTQSFELCGFIDDNPALTGKTVGEIPVLGTLSALSKLSPDEYKIVVALGSPSRMKEIVRTVGRQFNFASVICRASIISPSASIGPGSLVFPGVIVNCHVSVGNNVTLNVGATISHDTAIGAFCNVNPGACIAGNVRIAEGCFIGMGANVIQGIEIGAWSVVGAGAVVTRNVPSNVTTVGVPARVIKERKEG